MNPKELVTRRWVPHEPPLNRSEEILEPWTAPGRRLLTAVRFEDEVYVIAEDRKGKIVDSWKVL